MSTWTRHALVAFGGRLGGSGEVWQCNVRVATIPASLDGTKNNGYELVDPVAYMNAIATPLKNWFQTAASTTAGSEFVAMRNDANLDWLKVNNIASSSDLRNGKSIGGKYLSGTASNIYSYSAAGTGTGAAGVPPIITSCISWTTAKTRGPGHRGRIYPPFSFPSTNSINLSAGQMAGIARAGSLLLGVLNAPTDGVANLHVIPVVASSVDGSLNAIRGTAGGSVFDVQRRRKEQIKETYSTLAVTPPGF